MDSADNVRLQLSTHLETIRSKIARGMLVLFVGEQASALTSPDNPYPSLDDWWQVINQSEKGVDTLFDLEDKFLANIQQAPSRVHDALRNVGKFPVIITTNMDDLLERFLWKAGNVGDKVRLDQASGKQFTPSWPNLRRDLIIKCLGDSSFNVRTQPSSKNYFEDFCSTLESAEVDFMHRIFNERSVLFLGCDLHRQDYESFFQKFAVNAKMIHYNFETSDKSDLEANGNLLTLKVTIKPWEFVQLLSTGTIQEAEDIQPGEVYLRSYLRIQRDQYLQQQLALEKKASEIIFHTTTVTNALSPDEYFELISRHAIEDMFMKDSFGVYSQEKVQRTVDAMKQRRDNLIWLLKTPEAQTRITCLFFYHGVKREIQKWKEVEETPSLPEDEKQNILLKCKISVSKYAKVALLANSFMQRNSSMEIRIVDSEKYDVEKQREVERETFALIRLKGGTDEAICYADQASSPDQRNFASHLVNINGEEVANKRKVYEKSRLVAWSNEDSILKLATTIMKENSEMKDRFGIDAIESEDLADLEQLTRISNKFRSELDAGYFDRIGEGNFGYVYKAQKGKQDVAVKILKNKEDKDLINNFEREADMLRKANHPNIVQVISIHISKKSELSIVMEFMAGGNLKDLLRENKQGMGKEFTVTFIEDIGSAIEHLHSLGVMHRDVKPENIFLSKDHKVLKLGDFGLARATIGSKSRKTETGSYRYMAPEVMNSEGKYSEKSDVYSFGLCLVEVVSGKTVFDDIENDFRVLRTKVSGGKPNIPEISETQFGEEAAKIRKIIDECLKTEAFRPDMHIVLTILKKPLNEMDASGQKESQQVDPGSWRTADDDRVELRASEAVGSPYPVVVQAFKDGPDHPTADDKQTEEQPSGLSSSRYPRLDQVITDDIGNVSTSKSTEKLTKSSNPPYPTVVQSFEDGQNSPFKDDRRSDEKPSNEPYPPVSQSFK
ncbi:unnamed protein product [Porites lobata]|uniref:Protein kinase domain-containing protein n=2 Tax=Porites lobata TaxID=104759 RepID=A0ABN8S9M4_9CNID|nr:unnamed protein product [Porites lobata]